MFDDVFLFKIFLSFLTGGIFVTITLYAAERYGPGFGGVIAGLPSTTAVGLFFIGFVQSPQHASVASTIIPAAAGGSLVFVISYLLLCERLGYSYALLVSSVVWFMVSLPLAFLRIDNLFVSTLIFLLLWIITLVYMRKQEMKIMSQVKIKQKSFEVIARAGFAGTVVSVAVVLSSLFGPLWGGALAAFPAMFFTTFIILCRDYGCEYSKIFAKTTPLGLFGVMPYAWGVHYFYPEYGLIVGTVISYILSFAGAGLVYAILGRK